MFIRFLQFYSSGQPILQTSPDRLRVRSFDSSDSLIGARRGAMKGVFGSTLSISNVEMDDTGNYSCVSQNMFGSEQITYFLDVKRKCLYFTNFQNGFSKN